jgi:hypothetical protein
MMSTCDPAYETCPADNSTTAEAPAGKAFNPLIYAWGLIPVLDFVASFGNKSALNSYLADYNTDGAAAAAATTPVGTWTDYTWTTWASSEGQTWTSPPGWFFQDTLVLAQGVAMFASWAAALFVGGPAETVFLYTSKLDILLQLYNAYAYNAADAVTVDVASTAAVDESYETVPLSTYLKYDGVTLND